MSNSHHAAVRNTVARSSCVILLLLLVVSWQCRRYLETVRDEESEMMLSIAGAIDGSSYFVKRTIDARDCAVLAAAHGESDLFHVAWCLVDADLSTFLDCVPDSRWIAIRHVRFSSACRFVTPRTSCAKRIHVIECGLDDDTISPLWRFAANVQVLGIREQIGDKSLGEIADLKRLRELTLETAAITSYGISKLERCRTLRRLTLVDIAVDSRSAEAIGRLQELEWLELKATQVSDADEALLRRRLPNCDIDVQDTR